MAAKVQEKYLSVFCPVHKISFSAVRAGRILCESGRHSLAQSFPYGDFWEYCCDCQNFWPYDASAGGGQTKQCLNCARLVATRYLCSHCKVMSVESAEPEGEREFFIAPGEAPQPSCPACLELETRPLRRHECRDLGASFATARSLCPFCDQRIEGSASLPATALALILDEVRELKSRQHGLSSQLESAVAELNQKLDAHFSRQRAELAALELKLAARPSEGYAPRYPPAVAAPAAPPPASPGYQTLVVGAEEPAAFPVLVADYLNLVRRIATSVKSDSLKGILVKAADGAGEMVLVDDRSTPRDLLYVVPAVGSFKTRQDYYSFYEKYFDCSRPTGGEVWIVRPAVVGRVNGGWELREKGELEIS